MKLILFTALSLLPLCLFSQFDDILRRGLKKQDYNEFERIVDSLKNLTDNHPNVYWDIQRELVPGIKESVITIEKPGKNTGVFLQVNIISKNNSIVLYELKRTRMLEYPWPPADSLLDYSKNDSLYKELEFQFSVQFGGNINPQELFLDSVIYSVAARGCKSSTRFREKLSSMIANIDTIKLFSWLSSTNVETQLYAVEGIYKLKQNGVKFSTLRSHIIKNILRREGVYRTCATNFITIRKITSFVEDLLF
ncbi:MAG: hypothetical protein U0T79_05325 [Ferruginibacter sp.]